MNWNSQTHKPHGEDEGIQKLRNQNKELCFLFKGQDTNLSCDTAEGIYFTNTLRNKFIESKNP